MFDAARGAVSGFGLTFATMFRKVVTEKYPEVMKPTAPRYHGRHVLNRHPDGLEKCVGCELCAWACPADAIYVEGADNTDDGRYSPGERYGRIYLADDNRQDLIFTKEQLLAPLLPGMEAPPHPLRLGDSEQAYYVDVLDRTRSRAADSAAGAGAPGVLAADAASAGVPVNTSGDPDAFSTRTPGGGQ